MSNLENTWLLRLKVRRETIEEIQAKLISLETFGSLLFLYCFILTNVCLFSLFLLVIDIALTFYKESLSNNQLEFVKEQKPS
jgi:hypothetical protein